MDKHSIVCVRLVLEFESGLARDYGKADQYPVYYDQYVPRCYFPMPWADYMTFSLVVLTTTWCELMTDPNLFRRRFSASRDHKIMAIVTLFFGGFVGRCIIDKIGSAGTLGVGTGLRFLIALSWYFVPSKKTKT